ncbi:phosphatase PAP2 family protein [Actinomycetospora straminea]|uniref:Phosphatidic acid phosphatase type 2/haloperoxidase domain-containing protein n=1 Tax=Actinomycetospora straminea TaxID=663607 RepID=A0ABP9ENC7_9PSEU|nr:phosphatase PAP2 family protein [Actinomycetospora straminea]MDD7935090.1 phosphatase PAP2 family protein [Actinomycetospora straminea]
MALDATAVSLIVLGLLLGVAVLADRLAGGALADVPGALRDLAVVAVLVVAAGLVFALVATDEALAAADGPVLGWVLGVRTPGLTTTAEVVSLVGGTVGTGGLAVVSAVVLFARGMRRTAVIWVVGVAVGALTIRLVKLAVERPRPPEVSRLAEETTASLPSGHALMSALGLGLTAAAVVALAVGTPHERLVRRLAVALAVLGALVIGASRVYLGVHWTTDVLAGWLLGATLALTCVTLARVLDARARLGDGRDNPAVVSQPAE